MSWHHSECTGECIACLIERVVKQQYGTIGLNYLLKHIAARNTPLLYAPGTVLICLESDERVVVKHGNTGPLQLTNGKIVVQWSDETYGEYTLEQVMEGFIIEHPEQYRMQMVAQEDRRND